MQVGHAAGRWWRLAARALAAGLLVSAATVVVLQVDVTGADGGVRSCGSSFDVIAGRADWQQWWRADTSEPASTVLVRTVECPSAVNRRTGLAAGLFIGGAVLLVAAGGRRSVAPRLSGPPNRNRLVRLANVAIVAGAVLSIAGLVGLGVLLANPRSALFLYASRSAILLIGLAVLQPALALLVVGLALRFGTRARSSEGDR